MKISLLLDKLSNKYRILLKNIGQDTEINAVIPESDKEKITAPENTLLLSSNNTVYDPFKYPNVLYVLDSFPVDGLVRCGNRICLKESDTDLLKLQCEIQNLLLEDQSNDRLYLKLMKTLLEGQEISGVLDQASEIQKNSLAIIDMSGKILAHSSPFRVRDPIWPEAMKQGFCPPAFMRHIRKVQDQHKYELRKHTFIQYCDDFHLYYLCNKIYVSGALYGYVFMIQDSPDFQPVCVDIVTFIGKTVERSISQEEKIRLRTGQIRSSVIVDMIRGMKREEALSRIASSGLTFPPFMKVVVIRTAYYSRNIYFDGTAVEKLKSIFPNAFCTIYADSAVVVASLSDRKEIKKESLSGLKKYCEENRFVAGISSYFSSPLDIKSGYEQAFRTIRIALNLDINGTVFDYQDFFYYDMLSEFPSDAGLVRYCHPAIRILRDYDTEKDAHLYDTLKEYIRSGFSLAETASSMYLHRNTLAYRKKKMEDLTGINLDDPDTRFYLRCSYHIIEYLEHTKSAK